MSHQTKQSEVSTVSTVQVPLMGFTLVEIDTAGVNMDDPEAVLQAAKRQLPGAFINGVEWRIDDASEYQ